MEFVSGQKLTAQNLNSLVSLAEGQNIPTDGMFIKSKGVNVWKAPQAKPEVVKNHKIFDVQIRYHDVNDVGQEKDENYKPEYKPFWYVYLGTDCVKVELLNYDVWDIKIEAGSGVTLTEPLKIYSQPMPLPGETLDGFQYSDAITQMTHCEIDKTTGEVKNYKKFYAGKMLKNQSQTINSDLNGWFCTGLPAYGIVESDGEIKLMPTELYATFIRTNNTFPGIIGNIFFSVLVFSNSPIAGLGSLKKNGQYNALLPDGTTIQYAEIMGDHSQKIGSFKTTANFKYNGYGVENTSMIPRDDLSKEDHGWQIIKPTSINESDSKAAQQLVNYQFINTMYVHPLRMTLPFPGNEDGKGGHSLNIYFSDFNVEDLPASDVNAYYVDFSWTDDPEDGGLNTFLEIKKITEVSGSMTIMRDVLDQLVTLASAKIYNKNDEEKPITYHKLIAVFLLNTNGKISPEDGQPIPWTIEYVSYVDTMPNFANDLRYDYNLTMAKKISPKLLSIQRNNTQLSVDGTVKNIIVDEIYGFHDTEYRISSVENLSAEALIRCHGKTIDGTVFHQLTYVDLSALSGSISVDSEVNQLNLSSIGKYTTDGISGVYEIFNFHNLDNQVKLDDNHKANSDIIIRTRSGSGDKKPAIVEYLPLPALSVSSSEKISVDTQIENQTSSIQLLSTQYGEWYQLYNFDKANADIDAKIWTLGDLDSDKHGKTGKLIDPTTKNLLSVDILVRDNSTKQLKYMNLSVDPINVDTFSTNTKQKSLVYHKDQFQDRDYLSLKDFNTTPNTVLTATLSGNGLVDITGQNTWILTKKYNTANQMMELTYDKLQLSVDLSGVSADVRCDADVTLAQKSIQKKGDYIQLYNFTRPSITTKKTTLNSLSATYDLLDSDDAVLVRSGSQLTYKKLQIETKLPSSGGGGGETTGYTGTKTQATNLKWNSNGQYKVELWGCDFQYENGLLKSIGAEKKIATLDTVGYSGT